MPSWSRIAAITAAVALIPLAATLAVTPHVPASTSAHLDAGGRPRPAAAPLALAPPVYQPDQETQYTPITPCRIADTRPARIAAGATRNFAVSGTAGFPSQGGTSGGCGIPARATAVTLFVSAVNIAGTGYFRIWPYGLAVPNVTFAHYQAGPITTSSGTIPITTNSNPAISVRAYQHAAGIVIDVTGYYAPPLAGFISPSGSPYSGSPRILGASHIGTGVYEVRFDRNIRYCSAAVTVYVSAYFGTASTWFDSTRQDVVRVWLWTAAGAPVDQYFYINLLC